MLPAVVPRSILGFENAYGQHRRCHELIIWHYNRTIESSCA